MSNVLLIRSFNWSLVNVLFFFCFQDGKKKANFGSNERRPITICCSDFLLLLLFVPLFMSLSLAFQMNLTQQCAQMIPLIIIVISVCLPQICRIVCLCNANSYIDFTIFDFVCLIFNNNNNNNNNNNWRIGDNRKCQQRWMLHIWCYI